MKPNPLPSNPKLLDRVEYALQSLLCWAIVYWPARPMLSGLLTGLIIFAVIGGIAILVGSLQFGRMIHALQQTGHWWP